ncbi:MAG TPA: uracil-DNA glycosylase family protein [Nitrospiraceae bacterium]
MSFTPGDTKAPRRVPGVGPPNAKIAIVGEAPGAHEDVQLKPFVGAAGSVLEQCLHGAGLTRSEVYLTNVVKVRPANNKIDPYFNGKTFSQEGIRWVSELREELDALQPNIVVAAGNTAFAALAGLTSISTFRGYIFPTIGLENVAKCLPMFHPAACLYNQAGKTSTLAVKSSKPYMLRYVIEADLRKAREFSHTKELVRPERQLVYRYDNVEECLAWLDYFAEQPLVSVDIEVTNYEVSCIGFSSEPNIAASIPLAYTWTEHEEVLIWRGIDKILGNPNSVKVLQNGIFDIHFLHKHCGVVVRGPIQDTMIAHSIIFPELPKNLAFIGSIYCGAQEYWKNMVKWDNIKDES